MWCSGQVISRLWLKSQHLLHSSQRLWRASNHLATSLPPSPFFLLSPLSLFSLSLPPVPSLPHLSLILLFFPPLSLFSLSLQGFTGYILFCWSFVCCSVQIAANCMSRLARLCPYFLCELQSNTLPSVAAELQKNSVAAVQWVTVETTAPVILPNPSPCLLCPSYIPIIASLWTLA